MVLGIHVDVEHICGVVVAVAGVLAALRYYRRKRED